MVGWHYRLNGLEFEQTLGDSERQGSLVCCSPWGSKELDMTEQLNVIILKTILANMISLTLALGCIYRGNIKQQNIL